MFTLFMGCSVLQNLITPAVVIFDLLPNAICRSQTVNNGIVLPNHDKQVTNVISFI